MWALMKENLIFVVDGIILLFFIMRLVCGKLWGKAEARPVSILNFVKKEGVLLCLLILLVLQHLDISFLIPVHDVLRIVALFVAVIGVLLCYETRKERGGGWKRFGTEPPQNGLVTTGPYNFSRHPYYLGITLFAIGVAVASANAPLIVLAVLWLLGAMITAAREEQYCEAEYGWKWRVYRRQVPFWIGIPRKPY